MSTYIVPTSNRFSALTVAQPTQPAQPAQPAQPVQPAQPAQAAHMLGLLQQQAQPSLKKKKTTAAAKLSGVSKVSQNAKECRMGMCTGKKIFKTNEALRKHQKESH